jgi:hypothetical protein
MSSISRMSAVASVAIALLAACSPEQAPSITGPRGPSLDIGVAAAGQVLVCVDPSAPAGNYSIAISNVTNPLEAGDIAVAGPVVLTPNNCAVVFTKGAEANLQIDGVTLTASTGVAGTFSYTCSDNIAAGDPLCGATAGTNGAVANANGPHGSIVVFSFVADAPPPPADGCTYTQGWWKNQGDSASAIFDFDGGTDNGLSILNTPVKGNPYIALAHQYIAATLNIENGADITGDAQTAYNAATLYFASASIGTPLPAPYTKSQVAALTTALDLYNQGLSGTLHCDAEIIV